MDKLNHMLRTGLTCLVFALLGSTSLPANAALITAAVETNGNAKGYSPTVATNGLVLDQRLYVDG